MLKKNAIDGRKSCFERITNNDARTQNKKNNGKNIQQTVNDRR